MSFLKRYERMMTELDEYNFQIEQKPQREKAINHDDVTNLKIALETMTPEQFINSL